MFDFLLYYTVFSLSTALLVCKIQWGCFNMLGIRRGAHEALSYWTTTFVLGVMTAPIVFPGIILQGDLYKETILESLAEIYLGR